MSELIQQKKIELSARTQQILKLANDALDGAEQVRKRVRLSVEQGTECGRLLLEEQAEVTKRLGKGTWASYFEITFSKTLPLSTANSWMKSARDVSNKPVIGQTKIANEPLGNGSTQEPDVNAIRKGMLTLDLFPAKKHVPTLEAGRDAPTPHPQAHDNRQLLSIVSRFTVWHTAFMQENRGALPQEQCLQLLKDLKPISDFIESLRA